ncbi:hypothetical protein [Streptomyces acidiscabies]|uniref:hypothetical protein n=1 Tax=Streptomyces acidiscabies TaxID=42234 RepID=UPI0015C04469
MGADRHGGASALRDAHRSLADGSGDCSQSSTRAMRRAAPLAPQPGASDLYGLLDRVRAAGPAAELRTEGQLDALSPGLQDGIKATRRIVESGAAQGCWF